MYAAMMLREEREKALESASWGRFQVMGGSRGALAAMAVCVVGSACSRPMADAKPAPSAGSTDAAASQTAVVAGDAAASQTAVVASKGSDAGAPHRAKAGKAPEPIVDPLAEDTDSRPPKPTIVSEAEALAAMGQDHSFKIRLADWAARPGSTVALTFRSITPENGPKALQATVAIVDKVDSHVQLVASGQLNPELDLDDPCPKTPVDKPEFPPSIWLELAPYKISRSETAIGVRLKCAFYAPGARGTSIRLFLFRQQEKALEGVFAADVAFDNDDRIAHEEQVSHGIVLMQPTMTKGLFDILLRSNITISSADDDKPARKRVESERFISNGKRYQRH